MPGALSTRVHGPSADSVTVGTSVDGTYRAQGNAINLSLGYDF